MWQQAACTFRRLPDTLYNSPAANSGPRRPSYQRLNKKLSDKEASVMVEMLDGEKRQEELARMLSGRVTDRSLKHAGRDARD